MDKSKPLTPGKIELKNQKIDFYTKQKIRVFFYSTFFTIFMIAMVGGIGYTIDILLKTGHKFFIIGLVLAYPLTQYSLYRKYKGNSEKHSFGDEISNFRASGIHHS